jgi:septum formation protein
VYHPPVRLVLASRSPRRAELLDHAGYRFDVAAAEVDEQVEAGEHPSQHVARLAGEKAAAVARAQPDAIVIAADTVVVVDSQILGKPVDDDDARRMLRLLAGRWHDVLTGVVVRKNERISSAVAATRVHFLPLSDGMIDWYVASGEPGDKAGAYGIQGLASRFVDRIEGSYSNVVGLPIAVVDALLTDVAGRE